MIKSIAQGDKREVKGIKFIDVRSENPPFNVEGVLLIEEGKSMKFTGEPFLEKLLNNPINGVKSGPTQEFFEAIMWDFSGSSVVAHEIYPT